MAEGRKIMLWAVPRSVSTAFYRAMHNRPGTKCSMEPYAMPYYWGPARTSKRNINDPIDESYTFENVTKQLENLGSDNDVVFAKDMAYYLVHHFGEEAYRELPRDFIHTFIIRNPKISIPSLYKLSIDEKATGWNYFDPTEVGFQESYELYNQVTTKLGQEAVVIDSDDLLQNPEGMLRAYCAKVDIPYHDSMVNWRDDIKDMGLTNNWENGWFKSLFSSSKFESRHRPSQRCQETQPDIVEKCIQDNMEYFDHLYKLRLLI